MHIYLTFFNQLLHNYVTPNKQKYEEVLSFVTKPQDKDNLGSLRHHFPPFSFRNIQRPQPATTRGHFKRSIS